MHKIQKLQLPSQFYMTRLASYKRGRAEAQICCLWFLIKSKSELSFTSFTYSDSSGNLNSTYWTQSPPKVIFANVAFSLVKCSSFKSSNTSLMLSSNVLR